MGGHSTWKNWWTKWCNWLHIIGIPDYYIGYFYFVFPLFCLACKVCKVCSYQSANVVVFIGWRTLVVLRFVLLHHLTTFHLHLQSWRRQREPPHRCRHHRHTGMRWWVLVWCHFIPMWSTAWKCDRFQKDQYQYVGTSKSAALVPTQNLNRVADLPELAPPKVTPPPPPPPPPPTFSPAMNALGRMHFSTHDRLGTFLNANPFNATETEVGGL